MFWVAELPEFGSDFQLRLLQNNDCNSQNLHHTFLTQETQQIDLCVKFHFLHKTSLSILTYFLKNSLTSLDTEKDYANIKKEKSPRFRKMKS